MSSSSSPKKQFPRRCCLAAAMLLSALYISHSHIQLLLIQGNSMSPAYHHLQPVLLNKHPHSLQKGDVIAFHSAKHRFLIVKRIAALPGDTVQILRHRLYVNGIPESNSTYASIWEAGNLSEEITIPPNQYFVLGDNVNHSTDSRFSSIGLVSGEDIVGSLIPCIAISQASPPHKR